MLQETSEPSLTDGADKWFIDNSIKSLGRRNIVNLTGKKQNFFFLNYPGYELEEVERKGLTFISQVFYDGKIYFSIMVKNATLHLEAMGLWTCFLI